MRRRLDRHVASFFGVRCFVNADRRGRTVCSTKAVSPLCLRHHALQKQRRQQTRRSCICCLCAESRALVPSRRVLLPWSKRTLFSREALLERLVPRDRKASCLRCTSMFSFLMADNAAKHRRCAKPFFTVPFIKTQNAKKRVELVTRAQSLNDLGKNTLCFWRQSQRFCFCLRVCSVFWVFSLCTTHPNALEGVTTWGWTTFLAF